MLVPERVRVRPVEVEEVHVVWNGAVAKQTGRQPNTRPDGDGLDLAWTRHGSGTDEAPAIRKI